MDILEKSITPIEHCLICNCERIPFYYGKTHLASCKGCGLVSLAIIPSDEERASYYSQVYSLNQDIPKQKLAAEIRRWSRMPEQIKLIGDILKLKPPPSTILDIGCDRAPFLDEARRFGYTVIGVEPSISAREDAAKIGITTVSDIDFIPQQIDIAVLWHSLEHTGNPRVMLESIHSKLSSDGILAIRVPNFGSLWSRLLHQQWIWFQPENHCYHFTLVSLKNIVQRAGFDILISRSQRPSSILTLRAGSVAIKTFSTYTGQKTSIKRRLATLYQYITGIELYVIARKIQIN